MWTKYELPMKMPNLNKESKCLLNEEKYIFNNERGSRFFFWCFSSRIVSSATRDTYVDVDLIKLLIYDYMLILT